MRKLMWITAFWTVMCCVQCSSTAPEQTTAPQGIEQDYFTVLEALTALMTKNNNDAAENVHEIRAYITANVDHVSKTINEMNRTFLEMDESQRAEWQHRVAPKMREKLDEFARAQQRLNERLSESQKWELGEIISQLK